MTVTGATLTVSSVRLYRMQHEAHLSRNNQAGELLHERTGHDGLRELFMLFSQATFRTMLVLVLSDGREVSLFPSLKADVPADGEPGALEYDPAPADWETAIKIW